MLRDHIDETNEGGWIHDANARDWREIDRNLRRIAKRRAALDADEARWLREAVRGEIWREVGAASLHEYLEDRLGYTPRVAEDRVRVALAPGELPAMTEALSTGKLPFTAVRELVRVATPETEVAWREDSRGKHAAAPAQQVLEAEAGMRLDDDALIAALCAAVLEPREPARAQHQIHTIECATCGQGWQDGAGERLAIDAAALSRAQCDAERVDPATQRARRLSARVSGSERTRPMTN